jgi:hypothetical protein
MSDFDRNWECRSNPQERLRFQSLIGSFGLICWTDSLGMFVCNGLFPVDYDRSWNEMWKIKWLDWLKNLP